MTMVWARRQTKLHGRGRAPGNAVHRNAAPRLDAQVNFAEFTNCGLVRRSKGDAVPGASAVFVAT